MSASAPEAGRPLYFATLDGLRFFAFLLVFIHHLPRTDFGPLGVIHDQGWVGVHVFLALSAFLLTAILSAEHGATQQISIFKFYVRRALRIWPLYFAFIIGSLAFVVARHRVEADTLPRFGALFVFLDNVVSGFRGFNALPFAGHLWTISLEEQFYLVLPFLLRRWIADPQLATRRLVIIWGLFVGLRVVCVLAAAPHPLIWSAVFSADSLVFGTALAVSRLKLEGRWVHVLAPLGLVLLFSPALMAPLSTLGWHQVVIFLLIGLGATALAFGALHDPWLGFLGIRPLRYLGKISFGLYVFHLVGVAVGAKAAEKLQGGWLLNFAVSFLATLTLSVASYELFEKRVLRFKRRFETVHTRAP
ncbi:MAG: acyltransferase [Archangium sp.]